MNEANFIVINEHRRSEDNKFLVLAAIIVSKQLAMILLDILSIDKVKYSSTFYTETLKVALFVAFTKSLSSLPSIFDRLSKLVFDSVYIKTYD